MYSTNVWLLLAIFGGLCRYGQATCVLESDFGFVINCAFKKSGLFRVRNLGGVKALIGLGFSLGDELGFKQSFSNTEGNRRRSASASPFVAQAALLQQRAQESKLNETRASVNALPHAASVPSPKKMSSSNSSKVQTMTVPPFKPIPPAPERPLIPNGSSTVRSRIKSKVHPPPMSMGIATINNMPSSVPRISQGETAPATNGKSPPQIAILMPVKKGSSDKMSNAFALRTLATEQSSNSLPLKIRRADVQSNDVQNVIVNSNKSAFDEAQGGLDGNDIAMKTRANGSMVQSATVATTPPKSKYHKHSTFGKVMNAPKEYYPVGYDKNFDDNFSSRVDLPDTTFRCGDQKHFPGLYADEDLGCMVFHVCALTDDGLIMKSFLCPESTLFDQTILKCNWWFYVDCKNSKKLYDSNIPISKSYQLMKALTFFSSYNKDTRSNRSRVTPVKSATTKE